jgi:hypothetical protein
MMADERINEPGWAASDLDDHPSLANREAIGEATVAALRELIRPGEAFVLVDEEFLNIAPLLPERTCLRFGCGWPPGSEEPVVREFEQLRARGARYFVFAWPALWWLDFHRTLKDRIWMAAAGFHVGDGYIVFELFTHSTERQAGRCAE